MSLYYDNDREGLTHLAYRLDKKDKVDLLVDYIPKADFPEDWRPILTAEAEKDEMFFPAIQNFPKTDQVDHIYITGKSGTGKSTWIAMYIKMFKRMYPKACIYLFSSKTSDKTLDPLPIKRVPMTMEQVAKPYTLDQMCEFSKPSLVIFDDIETYPDNKITKEAMRLRDEVITNGRSKGLFCLYVNHDPCEYKATKKQIFEANGLVILPQRGGKGDYDYLLEKKLKMKHDLVQRITVDLDSNWVYIRKDAPEAFISDRWIILNK